MKIKGINRLPPVIDFLITSKCNLNCPFCFGPKEQSELPYSTLKKIIAKACRKGIKSVIISGGEPLLYANIVNLIHYCWYQNLHIVLVTNGILLKKKMSKILPYIDWISLPIESADIALNDKLRYGYNNYLKLVLDLIKEIQHNYSSVKIKLGTVVSKKNINQLDQIADLLHKKNIYPDIWKFYQFASRGKNAVINRNKYIVSNVDFLRYTIKTKQKFKKIQLEKNNFKTKVVIKLNQTCNNADLFINPNGDAIYVLKSKYKKIGNVSHNFESVLLNWQKKININQLIFNNNLTYPGVLSK